MRQSHTKTNKMNYNENKSSATQQPPANAVTLFPSPSSFSSPSTRAVKFDGASRGTNVRTTTNDDFADGDEEELRDNDRRHNNGQGYEDRHTVTSNEGSDSNADSLDTDDEHDDGLSNNRSSASGSSGSSRSKSLALKSTLPCGMSMPVLMTLVILVPIIFLVTYSALPLDEALRAEMFLDYHRSVFDAIRQATLYNTFEIGNSSSYIVYSTNFRPSPYPSYADEFRRDMLYSRQVFDQHMRIIINAMRDSDVAGNPKILDTLSEIQQQMAIERTVVETTAKYDFISPYRQRQVKLMEKLVRVFLFFAKDPRLRLLRHHLLIYTTIRELSLHLGSAGRELEVIVLNGATALTYERSSKVLLSRADSISGKLEYISDATEGDSATMLYALKTSPSWKSWIDVIDLVLIDSNYSRWSHVTLADKNRMYNAVNDYTMQIDRELLNEITDGTILRQVVVRESLLMSFALLVCIFALACCIYYNRKEQSRLERALDSTAVLANAVQRFVPRNQLKTMGVRSITQVQAGMTTEVAQSIIFSDIRGFTRLAESMSRLELFDWLQNYVSRMTKVVSEEKSYIMAFLGDGLGICSPQPTYAVNAAIKMHVAVEALNLDLVAKGGTLPIQIGVGIHHGVVVAGVFGDANRLTVSMIASEVNFASRLEALTKSFGVKILASDAVIDQISSEVFSFRNVGRVQVKGSSQAVKVYDIYQADSLRTKMFKDATKKDFEHAISVLDSDRPQADRIFERLVMQARMEGLHDMSSEIYYRRKDTNGASDASSVLSFEKDGNFFQVQKSANDAGRVDSSSKGAISDFLHHSNANSARFASLQQPRPDSGDLFRSIPDTYQGGMLQSQNNQQQSPHFVQDQATFQSSRQQPTSSALVSANVSNSTVTQAAPKGQLRSVTPAANNNGVEMDSFN